MRAIVGLGNPGPEYARTRHNAGFLLADALAERWGWSFRRAARVRVAQGVLADGIGAAIIKPQTYMNRSGTALAGLPPADLLVLVDEYQLPLGSFRIRPSGSAGGHNGLKSVEQALGTQEYARLRIGIGPLPADVVDRADWVLAPFAPAEWDTVGARLPAMVEAAACWAREGTTAAMNQFNQPGTSE